MQTTNTPIKYISVSEDNKQSIDESPINYTYQLKSPFEVYTERDWENTLEKCSTHFFTQETLLGHIAKRVFHCGYIVCDKPDCIKTRMDKFVKSHAYLHDNNVQIKILKVNNLNSTHGINTAFKDLNEYSKYYSKKKTAYTILLGKTRMWLIYKTKKEVFQTRKGWYFERLLNDYVNLSRLSTEATNDLMDNPGRKRIRTHNMNEKKEKVLQQPKIACMKIKDDYIALLKKKRFAELKEHKTIPKIEYRVLSEVKFLTYCESIIKYKELISNPEMYWQEITAYFGKQHNLFSIV